MAIAEADAAASALHDQPTFVRARDEARDDNRELLRNGGHEMHAGPFLDDREAWAISHDPHDRSEAFAAASAATSSAHRRVESETPPVPPLVRAKQPESQPELHRLQPELRVALPLESPVA